jgi:hypothetical protein
MSAAVLKNRILGLTGGSFLESDYGAERFTQLLASRPDIVAMDYDTAPPTVRLLQPVSDSSQPVTGQNQRIRPDLWRAMLDFSSGLTYVWKDGRAQPADSDSVQSGERVIPTITADELRAWRDDFVTALAPSLREQERLVDWVGSRGNTAALPARLRGDWNRHLKQSVYGRLVDWFGDVGVPVDLVQTRQRDSSKEERLRPFLLRAISRMSPEELAQIQLPASVVFRLFE